MPTTLDDETAAIAAVTQAVDAFAVKAPPALPEGLYFGLDEARYHADPALGSGSVRELAKCPIYYWGDSWMNPFREERAETPALLYGRALHCLVLEGPDEFAKRYQPAKSRADHPEALDRTDDIKNRLRAIDPDVRKANGIKLTGVKDELIAYLRIIDPTAKTFDEIDAAHRADCIARGITVLPAQMHAEIVQGAAYILGDPRVAAAFRGGRPEVSIFWTEGGVPMKARLDYLRLGKEGGKPIAVITDIKSFANQLDLSPERAVTRAIAASRLDVQTAAYFRGTRRVAEFIRDGKVFGADGVNADWLKALASVKPEDWRWYWCFYEKGLPVALLRSTRPTSPVISAANMTLERALQAYRDNVQAFGVNWRFVDPIPDPEVTLDDLPKWIGND